MSFCKKCGKELTPNTPICMYCGASAELSNPQPTTKNANVVVNNTVAAKPKKKMSKKKKKIIIISIISIILLAIIIPVTIFIFNYLKYSKYSGTYKPDSNNQYLTHPFELYSDKKCYFPEYSADSICFWDTKDDEIKVFAFLFSNYGNKTVEASFKIKKVDDTKFCLTTSDGGCASDIIYFTKK